MLGNKFKRHVYLNNKFEPVPYYKTNIYVCYNLKKRVAKVWIKSWTSPKSGNILRICGESDIKQVEIKNCQNFIFVSKLQQNVDMF